MAWRKWFVRGVVFSVVFCCAGMGYVYQQLTNPAAVREIVLTHLGRVFPGARVSVDSSRLRLLGDIEVKEIRLVRKDDPGGVDFAHFPSAIFHHDKQKLLDGELSLRKIELIRPRLRVFRDTDGKWNLANLIQPPRLDRFNPTIVIRQGTLIFEDRQANGNISPFEITDLQLTLINDPLPTLNFDGVAQSPMVGKLAVHGRIQRATGELELTFRADDMPLSPRLIEKAALWCAKDSLSQLVAEGRADLELKLRTDPDRPGLFQYDAKCRLRDATVKHPRLPIAFEKLSASFRAADGDVTVEKLEASSGASRFSAKGRSRLPCPEREFDLELSVEKFRVTDPILAQLPEKVEKTIRLFRPDGTATVKLSLRRRDGKWAELDDGREPTVSILPENASGNFVKFPYPLTGATGSIDYLLMSKRADFEVRANAGSCPVTVSGVFEAKEDDYDLKAEVRAIGAIINDTLLSALEATPQHLARSFRATGKVDALAIIRHAAGREGFDNAFHLTFREISACWDPFPLPLKNVSGQLDIRDKKWAFHDFRAEHGGGVFQVQGHTVDAPGKEKPGVFVRLTGKEIPFDAPLERAMEPMAALKKAWSVFQPSGKINFTADVLRLSESLEDLEVRVQAEGIGMAVEPTFFRHRIEQVQGIVHYKDKRLDLAQVSGKHGAARWVLPRGTVELRGGDGYHADLPEVDIENFMLDEEFLKAAPESIRHAATALNCVSPLRVKTRLVVDQVADGQRRPEIYWDGQAWLRNGSTTFGLKLDEVTGVIACRGLYDGNKIVNLKGNLLLEEATVLKQTFRKVQAGFKIEPQSPDQLLANIFAPIYGGDLTGEVRVDFGSTVRFEVSLTASKIDLKEFGRKNVGSKSQLDGKAEGRLLLTGTNAGIPSLDGNGKVDVVGGHLYNLPLLLDLLKFLGLRWPDRTAFEEMHALFAIHGRRVTMRRLELQGNAISLTGQGDFNLDGTDLQLDFYPTWGRIDQILPPALRPLPPAVSKNFLIIEMRGQVSAKPSDLKFSKKLVPVVVDPLIWLRDRIRGNQVERRDASERRLPVDLLAPEK